jgi:hypothetical protein
VDFIPECVGQIQNDGSEVQRRKTHWKGKSLEGLISWWGKPRRNIEEIARMQDGIELTLLAPPNIGRAAEHVRDRVLLTVMVDCRAGCRFNTKDATTHGRVYASLRIHGCETL